jgi:hypothetical protein
MPQLMVHLVVIQSLQQLHLPVEALVQVILAKLLEELADQAVVAVLEQAEAESHQRKDLLVELA